MYTYQPAEKYIWFDKRICGKSQKYMNLSNYPNKILLKLIDEYNLLAKKWI